MLLPLLSKAMKHIVHGQLKAYLDNSNIIHPSQHGFRAKHSCCTALLTLSNRLLTLSNRLSTARNSGLFSSIAALNYSRAFDTLNHQLLLNKMKSLNFSLKIVSWFSSYLSGRRHFVRFNGEQSDMLATSFGIPQGSLMGPSVFLIYINDLLQQLPPDLVTAYADDVILFASGDSIGDVATSLQHYSVSVWSLGNCLQLNAAKYSCMHVASSKRKAAAVSHCSPINVVGTEIADVSSMKILGVIFTCDLNWKLQARHTAKYELLLG